MPRPPTPPKMLPRSPIRHPVPPPPQVEWKVLVVDEGHRVKNAGSRLVGVLRHFGCRHRILLTGTPLQAPPPPPLRCPPFQSLSASVALGSVSCRGSNSRIHSRMESLKLRSKGMLPGPGCTKGGSNSLESNFGATKASLTQA